MALCGCSLVVLVCICLLAVGILSPDTHSLVKAQINVLSGLQATIYFMIKKIISGGQTGVDRAALDVAIKLNIPHGGWCPRGRKAEDGVIPFKYQLQETNTDQYSERTELNIINSDATLILVPEIPINVTDGTILTIEKVKERNKPYLVVNILDKSALDNIHDWIIKNNIEILNIAGPRESQSLGIYQLVFDVIENYFSSL